MTDSLTFLQFAPPAGVCVIGLALAIAFRRRLDRAAWLAIAAFMTLSMTYVGALLWVGHLDRAFVDAPTADEAVRIAFREAGVRGVISGVAAVGFVLLLAAVVAGPGRTRAHSGD